MSLVTARDRPASGLERLARLAVLLGVVMATWTSVTIRGQVASDLLLYGGGCALLSVRSRPILLPRSSRPSLLFLPITIWLLLVGAALLAASSSNPQVEIGIVVRLILSLVGIVAIVVAFFRTTADGTRLMLALLISLAFNGAAAIGYAVFNLGRFQQIWNESQPFSTERVVGLTNHPNIVGYASACIIPAVPFMWKEIVMIIGRLPLVCLTMSALAALVLSGSRGGALAVIVATALTAAYSGRRRARRVLAASAVLVVGVLISLPRASLARRLRGSSDAVASNESRVANLEKAWSQLRSSFPSGVGLAEMTEIHSGLLGVLVAGGVLVALGFVVWGVGILKCIRVGLRLPGERAHNLALGCSASAFGALVFLVTSPMIYHRYAVIAPAICVALACGLTQRTTSDGHPPAERQEAKGGTSAALP